MLPCMQRVRGWKGKDFVPNVRVKGVIAGMDTLS